jgi:hypothetical protein
LLVVFWWNTLQGHVATLLHKESRG